MLTEVLNKSKMWFTSKFKRNPAVDQATKVNKTVVSFLEVEVLNITLDELKLLREKEMRLIGTMIFKHRVHDNNPKKITVSLSSFTQNFKEPRSREKLGIRSNVEFRFEAGLWIPRKLELLIDIDPPKIFLCEVTRNPDGFRYSYDVEKVE